MTSDDLLTARPLFRYVPHAVLPHYLPRASGPDDEKLESRRISVACNIFRGPQGGGALGSAQETAGVLRSMMRRRM